MNGQLNPLDDKGNGGPTYRGVSAGLAEGSTTLARQLTS